MVILPHWQSESNWQQVSPNSGTFIRLKFSHFTAPFSIFFLDPANCKKNASETKYYRQFFCNHYFNRLMHANVQKYPLLVAIFICLLLSLTSNMSVIPTFAKNLIMLYLFIFAHFSKPARWSIILGKLRWKSFDTLFVLVLLAVYAILSCAYD